MDPLAADTANKESIEVTLNLREALKQIYVAPSAPAWHATALQDVVSRFGLDRGLIKHSRLYDPQVS
jgi:hypothetical protein